MSVRVGTLSQPGHSRAVSCRAAATQRRASCPRLQGRQRPAMHAPSANLILALTGIFLCALEARLLADPQVGCGCQGAWKRMHKDFRPQLPLSGLPLVPPHEMSGRARNRGGSGAAPRARGRREEAREVLARGALGWAAPRARGASGLREWVHYTSTCVPETAKRGSPSVPYCIELSARRRAHLRRSPTGADSASPSPLPSSLHSCPILYVAADTFTWLWSCFGDHREVRPLSLSPPRSSRSPGSLDLFPLTFRAGAPRLAPSDLLQTFSSFD